MIQLPTQIFSKNFQTLFLVIILLFPILNLPFFEYDYADGVVFDSALRVGNFDGVYNWWTESGLVPYIAWTWLHEKLLFVLSRDVIRTVSPSATYLLLVTSLFLFVRTAFSSNVRTTLKILIPISFLLASLLSSSVFWPMLTFFSIGILGVWGIMRFGRIGSVVGVPMIILGMSYFHTIPFLALFGGMFALNRNQNTNETEIWFWSIKGTIATITLLFLYAVIYLVIWKQHGLYGNYGAVKISMFALQDQLLGFLKSPLIFCACVLVLIASWKQKSPKVVLALGLLLSFFGCMGVFALAGKYVNFSYSLIGPRNYSNSLNPFSLRYLIPMIALVYLALCASLLFTTGIARRLIKVTLLWFSVLMTGIYASTVIFAYQHQNRSAIMVEYLANLSKNDQICMIDPDSPVGHINYQFYQLNYLVQRANNRLPGQVCVRNWENCLNATKGLCSRKNDTYLLKYIIDPKVCERALVDRKVTPVLCTTSK